MVQQSGSRFNLTATIASAVVAGVLAALTLPNLGLAGWAVVAVTIAGAVLVGAIGQLFGSRQDRRLTTTSACGSIIAIAIVCLLGRHAISANHRTITKPPRSVRRLVLPVSRHAYQTESFAVSPNGQFSYVSTDRSTTQFGGRLFVIDNALNQVTRTIRFTDGFTADTIAISPNGRWLYAASADTDVLRVYSTRTFAVARSLGLSDYPEAMAVSPNGRQLALTAPVKPRIGLGYPRWVSVVDTRTFKSVDIKVGETPDSIAFTRSGTTALVANRYSNTLSAIDIRTDRVTKTITVGHGPEGVALLSDKGGPTAWVTNSTDGTVSFVDVNAGTELFSTKVYRGPTRPGSGPSQIAVDQNSGQAYICNQLYVTSIADTGQPDATAYKIVNARFPSDITVSPTGTVYFILPTLDVVESFVPMK